MSTFQLPNLQSMFSPLPADTLSGLRSYAPNQPSGQTDPSKVAASTVVKNPATPATTQAQSSVIQSSAGGGDLTSQLYAGKNAASPQPSLGGKPATNQQAVDIVNQSMKPATPATPVPATPTPTTPATPATPVPATPTPTTPATPTNAMLDDPELSSLNANIADLSQQQQAAISANSVANATDKLDAANHPVVGDFLSNELGYNNQAATALEGVLGNEITGENAAFTNRENQIKEGYTQTPVAPGNVNVNPYTGEPVASAPQVAQFGQGYYTPPVATPENPTGGAGAGSTNGGGTLNPLNDISSIASQVLSGKLSPSQAYAMGGSVSNFQSALNAEIMKQNPNANLASLQGNFDAQQSNTTLGGEATPTAANSVYQKAYGDYQDLQQNVQNVGQFGSLLTSNMTAGGINPSDAKFANWTIAQIRSQLSSGAQAQFDSTLAALQSKISGMLAIGGSEIPTQLSSDASKIMDGSLPLSALNDVLARIQQEGNVLLSTQAQKVNDAKTTVSGGTVSSGSTSGKTAGGNSYTITP